jgi:hypothetical protein
VFSIDVVEVMRREDADRLKQLISEVRAADGEAESYRTWRHPEDHVWDQIKNRMVSAQRALDDFIESLVRK